MTYQQTILGTPDVKAYWRLGDLIELVAGKNLTQSGSPATVGSLLVGQSDGAKEFFGLETDLLDSTDVDALGTAYSMSAWVKPDASGGIFFAPQQAPGRPYLRVFNSDITFSWQDSANVQRSLATLGDAVPMDGSVHFVVATHDGVTAKIYIDGVLNNQTSTWDTLSVLSFPWRIGRYRVDGFPLDGTVDELALFARALQPEEIANMYEWGSVLHNTHGTVQVGITIPGTAAASGVLGNVAASHRLLVNEEA